MATAYMAGVKRPEIASGPVTGDAMAETNQRGVRLAQVALAAYYEGRQGQRRGGIAASGCDWSESDMVDLITDLLLLARAKDHDLSSLLRKVEAHIRAETGREC